MDALLHRSFIDTALAFPGKVRASLANITSPAEAAKVVRGGDALLALARDLRAGKDSINAMQHGRLLLIAKAGELLPAMTREEAGSRKGQKGITAGVTPLSLHANTITAYRKVAKHGDKIEKAKAPGCQAAPRGPCAERGLLVARLHCSRLAGVTLCRVLCSPNPKRAPEYKWGRA